MVQVPNLLARGLAVLSVLSTALTKDSSTPCVWDSKTGSHFDLRPLTITQKDKPNYNIVDGDIPCTPEIEPAFGYVWNFCSAVSTSAEPKPCSTMGKHGVVLQYLQYSEDEYYCYILGHYDQTQHQLQYELLDATNPSKGISIKYPAGEKCNPEKASVLRSATVNVECANVESIVESAQEPSLCQYHLTMKSYYGCPTECPVTGNGLCDSHGHCAYDTVNKVPYCYCNEGYTGKACNKEDDSSSYDGYSVQIGLLVTLLIIALVLTGGVVYLAMKIQDYRKEQIANNYKSLPGEAEMIETVNF